MKIDYLPKALENLHDAAAEVRKAFFKQVKISGARPLSPLFAREEV
jgi:mRNA-degrading endonuclease RelE of RelBE toxin-antitoxin system